MLIINSLYKYYQEGKNKKVILDNINLEFGGKELVFILGKSGSGKSTLLNIIGGNLRCDKGDILLDNIDISKLSEKKLNSYRSSVIGNVFQDYNLIDYMDVFDNVMLGYSHGLSKAEIYTLLKQLGIYDKRWMKVSKLSGGEKQRVAIARALVNNPKIILADEPTGALDSANGYVVMDILKKISHNKLVIVVSHDEALAKRYADRIIKINDGKCEVTDKCQNNEQFGIYKKKKIKYLNILKLAIKNLWLKKGRTCLTSIAISLGIISMFLVINMYSNFNREINDLEKDIVSVFPITISNGEYPVLDEKRDKQEDKIIIKNNNYNINKINNNYLEYLNNIKEIEYLIYNYEISMPIISDSYKLIDNNYMKIIPSNNYINDNYEIVYGRNINNYNEILLKIDSNNMVDKEILAYFGIDRDIDYDELIGRELRVSINDDYYKQTGDYYVINNNYQELYDKSIIKLIIVGIVKEKEVTDDNSYLFYQKDINELVINNNKNSEIVSSQLEKNYNVLGINMDKDKILSYLGYKTLPYRIDIYVGSIINKDIVISKLDEYNENNNQLIYIDTMSSVIDTVKEFIQIITIILVLFSVVAIIVSLMMIGILTNVRVLERKKEIGIFRSLGASKRNIRSLFNLENIMISLLASLISSIVITLIANPLNQMIDKMLGIDSIFNINYVIMIRVLFINILIVKIAGSIPARKASRLEIVKCIYNRE